MFGSGAPDASEFIKNSPKFKGNILFLKNFHKLRDNLGILQFREKLDLQNK